MEKTDYFICTRLKGNEALPWEHILNRLHSRLMASVPHRRRGNPVSGEKHPHTNMSVFQPISGNAGRPHPVPANKPFPAVPVPLSRKYPAVASLNSRPEPYSHLAGEKPL